MLINDIKIFQDVYYLKELERTWKILNFQEVFIYFRKKKIKRILKRKK